MTYLSWALPTESATSTHWWDRALSWATNGRTVAAYPDVPCECVTVQPWTMSLHLPTVAARLAVVDPEVRPVEDEPGFQPS